MPKIHSWLQKVPSMHPKQPIQRTQTGKKPFKEIQLRSSGLRLRKQQNSKSSRHPQHKHEARAEDGPVELDSKVH